jgi:hypothetical protein
MSETDSNTPSDSTTARSALWMFFVARFREEYGFEPNPRDKSVREYFSWYGWGHYTALLKKNEESHPR